MRCDSAVSALASLTRGFATRLLMRNASSMTPLVCFAELDLGICPPLGRQCLKATSREKLSDGETGAG